MESLAVVYSTQIVRLLKRSVLPSKPLNHKQMKSPSKGAPIYYMSARVAFKKKKVVHERLVWVVSVFDTPNDIRNHDPKTMSRLEQEFYGKTKGSRSIMIREIVEKKLISHSNLTLNEHKEQNKKQMQAA